MNINAPHKSINTHKMKTSGYKGEQERERERDFKDLGHMILGAGKSQICRPNWQVEDSVNSLN